MVCSACGSEIHAGARFCSACGGAVMGATVPVQRRLVRPLQGKMIAGVCAAFAQAYGWDVVVVRLVLVVAALCCAGTPVLAYLIAWIVIPKEQYVVPGAGPQAAPPQGATSL